MKIHPMRLKEATLEGKYRIIESQCPGCGITTGYYGKQEGKHRKFNPETDSLWCTTCADKGLIPPPKKKILDNQDIKLHIQNIIAEEVEKIKKELKGDNGNGLVNPTN